MKLYEELRGITVLWLIRHGITDAAAAAALGCSKSAFRDWCAGRSVLREPALENLVTELRAVRMLPNELYRPTPARLNRALADVQNYVGKKVKPGRPRMNRGVVQDS
ncbi:MAG TPA: hypothetical protein PLE60_14230 [Candidatus Latescibacteria bacterium]|nr:hypothetical protein [Candidatus Latescibacterota bacterium]